MGNRPLAQTDPSGLATSGGAAGQVKAGYNTGKSSGKKLGSYFDKIGDLFELATLQNLLNIRRNTSRPFGDAPDVSDDQGVRAAEGRDRQVKSNTVNAGVCGVNEVAKPIFLSVGLQKT